VNNMPKVSNEYILNKKKLITDAAYELCIEKTVSTVTMQDIINRSGLSQGGIYRFYSDIDEILSDMLAELRKNSHLKEKADEIFAKTDKIPPCEVTYQIFDMLGDYMTQELMGSVKIDFELSVLAMNAPERMKKIISGTNEMGQKEYILMRTAAFFEQSINNTHVEPKVSPDVLMAYITSAYTGIQMNSIVYNCYRSGSSSPFQPKKVLKALAESINHLLGLSAAI